MLEVHSLFLQDGLVLVLHCLQLLVFLIAFHLFLSRFNIGFTAPLFGLNHFLLEAAPDFLDLI